MLYYTKHYYSYTCSTVTWIYYHTVHCHFMYIYYHYTYTIILDTIVSYSCTSDTRIHCSTGTVSYICITATRILCTQLFHGLITLLYRLTCIPALIILYSCCMDHCSCYMNIPVFLLHDCFLLLI